MCAMESVKQTFSTMKKEYKKQSEIEKFFDFTSLIGLVLFIIAFIVLYASKQYNSVNIGLTIFPLFLGGIASYFSMKIRQKTEPLDYNKVVKEWFFIIGGYVILLIFAITFTLIVF